jgi:hypothetical protein
VNFYHTDREVTAAVIEWLDANQLGTTVVASATPTRPAIFMGAMPTSPDDAVTVNVYNTSHQRSDTGNPDIWIQFRWRAAGGDPRRVGDMADAAGALLDDQSHFPLNDRVHVRYATRTVRTPIGQDENRRYERADSYLLSLKPPR